MITILLWLKFLFNSYTNKKIINQIIGSITYFYFWMLLGAPAPSQVTAEDKAYVDTLHG